MSSLKIKPNEIRKINSQYILFPTVSLSYNNTVSAQTLLESEKFKSCTLLYTHRNPIPYCGLQQVSP